LVNGNTGYLGAVIAPPIATKPAANGALLIIAPENTVNNPHKLLL
jgi:hypothetical protein